MAQSLKKPRSQRCQTVEKISRSCDAAGVLDQALDHDCKDFPCRKDSRDDTILFLVAELVTAKKELEQLRAKLDKAENAKLKGSWEVPGRKAAREIFYGDDGRNVDQLKRQEASDIIEDFQEAAKDVVQKRISYAEICKLKSRESGDNYLKKEKDSLRKTPSQCKSKYGGALGRCKFCNIRHLWGSERCPAFGKICSNCKMKNHSAEACRNRSYKKMNKAKSCGAAGKNNNLGKVYRSTQDKNIEGQERKTGVNRDYEGFGNNDKDVEVTETCDKAAEHEFDLNQDARMEKNAEETSDRKAAEEVNDLEVAVAENIDENNFKRISEKEDIAESELKQEESATQNVEGTNLRNMEIIDERLYAEEASGIEVETDVDAVVEEFDFAQYIRSKLKERGDTENEVKYMEQLIGSSGKPEERGCAKVYMDTFPTKTEKCEVCNKPSTLKCTRCKWIYYCCKQHQLDDWKKHRSLCKQMSPCGFRILEEPAEEKKKN